VKNVPIDDLANGLVAGHQTIASLLKRGAWAKLAENLGFDVSHRTQIPPSACSAWGIGPEVVDEFERLEVLAVEPGFRLILAEGEANYDALRRAMLGVRRLNPDDIVLWWWVGADRVSVALVDDHCDGRRFVRRMDVDRCSPDSVGLHQWEAMAIGDLAAGDLVDPVVALRRHLNEVLAQEGLTREFFVGFKRCLELLCEQMSLGPEDQRGRHDVALATLLRMVFLYFLQRRGALDGDPRFVLRQLRRARAQGDNFYQTVLKPLFFGALNCARGQREQDAARLGELPFLNGGLFEPLPIEQKHPGLTWPDEVFGEVVEELLERYHFAVEETQGADEQRAVDPEMLGRVFEGLMYGESRQTSGSFYTPRDIVRRLVDEALGGYFEDTTDLEAAQISDLLLGERIDVGDARLAEVHEALASVRILDPAVGTGAFLLEALHALRRCHQALASPMTTNQDPLAEYRQVRELIHEHLFGVDVQHTAVRLCELRLWLSLLTTLPKMPTDELPPLPNLSHKVCVGNSLLSPTDLVRLRSGDRSFAGWADVVGGESNGELIQKLGQAQRGYLTSHGSQKAAMRQEIGDIEKKLQRAMLETGIQSLRSKLEPLTALSTSKDLFGESVELRKEQSRQKTSIEEKLIALEGSLAGLDAGREAPLAFSYATRFGQLLDAGGFDIVITNPPWVRAHRIDAAQRDVLRSRYRCHRRKLWPGAKKAGIRAPFGPQIDLSALFVQRSLELLRDGGRLCGLVPSKLFRSLHGTALREQLADHAIIALEDYSDSSRSLFDATAYPAMLHVKKRAMARPHPAERSCREPNPVRVSVWSGDERRSWKSDTTALFAKKDTPGAPWILAEPSIDGLFDKMHEVSVRLGEVERLQPMRGLFTGCNALFIHEEDEARALLGTDFAEFSRPVLAGRDVRPWAAEPERRILWPYDSRLDLRSDLPEQLRRYFAGNAERLEGRSDHRRGQPLWQMFRVKEGVASPKVVWRDLSPKLEAALAPSQVVPLNTVYFIPLADDRQARLVAALLNSPPVRAAAYALGERARGGWRRHFAWVMRLLPVPRRFVDFLEGHEADLGSELYRLEREVGSDNEQLSLRLSSELFELDPAEMSALEAWRTGEGRSVEEVA
jgi:hypothetical protein